MRAALADLIETAIDSVHDMDVTHRDYAEAAADAVLANVPGLVWEDFEEGRGAKARVFYSASYLITQWSASKYELAVSYPGYQAVFNGPRFYDSLALAKAAAEADHRARLAASLGLTDGDDQLGGQT